MAVMSIEELYEKYVRDRPSAERIRLVELTAHDLARADAKHVELPKRSIMELHGLGAEVWKDIDAQEYFNELRNEWDSRS